MWQSVKSKIEFQRLVNATTTKKPGNGENAASLKIITNKQRHCRYYDDDIGKKFILPFYFNRSYVRMIEDRFGAEKSESYLID